MAAQTALMAVLFVELADFSDLAAADERKAVEALESYRRLVSPVVAEHEGEVVDATGSELLVVFSSAVSAVQCALHLSLVLGSFGASQGLAGSCRARVGVHLGEIWREGARVYGNGVNVAARVMQVAPEGALYVSEDVYRQVAGKLDLSCREVEGVGLKNIDRPIALYEIDAGRGFLGPARAAVPLRRPAADEAPRPDRAGRRSSRAALELRESIQREVEGALANLPDAVEGRGGVTGQDELDAAMERASKRLSSALSRLFVSLVAGAVLAYGYAATGRTLFGLGAIVAGLLPLLSSVRRIVEAKGEMRLLEKRAGRGSARR